MNRKTKNPRAMFVGPGLALATFIGGLAYGLSPRASATVDSNERALAQSAELVDFPPAEAGAPGDDDMASPPDGPDGVPADDGDSRPGCPPDSGGQAAGPALGMLLSQLKLTKAQRHSAQAILATDRIAMRAFFDAVPGDPEMPPSPDQMDALKASLHAEQTKAHTQIVKLLSPAQAAHLAAEEKDLCTGDSTLFPPPAVPPMPA